MDASLHIYFISKTVIILKYASALQIISYKTTQIWIHNNNNKHMGPTSYVDMAVNHNKSIALCSNMSNMSNFVNYFFVNKFK